MTTTKLVKTVHPPVNVRRFKPDMNWITDEHREKFFTNVNADLLKAIRRIKNI